MHDLGNERRLLVQEQKAKRDECQAKAVKDQAAAAAT
jgi:hypothetical protein